MGIYIGVALLNRFLSFGPRLIEQLKITEDSPIELRSRFKLRLLALAVVLPLPPLLLLAAVESHLISRDIGRVIDQWIPFVDMGFGLLLAPAVLFRSVAKPPPPSGEDDDEGGWTDPPPRPPHRPRGGLPLPDASQSRSRFRDHGGPRTAPDSNRRRTPGPSPLSPARR
jgi:hypothetical protein